MKKFKSLVTALMVCCSVALIYAAASNVVTMRSRTPQNGVITAENSGKDTLTGAGARNRDTGYVWAYISNPKKAFTVDVYVTQLTGSITATSMVLQGCYDTGSSLLTADWENITGVTTYNAGFVGSSSTTVPGSAKHYKWFGPASSNNWNFVRVSADHTGTFTATYTGKIAIEN